jgi:hypothetical protein
MIKKMVLFAAAVASRGLNNKKIDVNTKRLRVLSCFGFNDIPKCPKLSKSKTSNYYYCSGCGCGDKPHTWLVKGDKEYAKLDYPSLSCPLKMPGFTNYDPNHAESKERRELIENFNPEDLEFIQVTIGESEEKDKIINELNKIVKNS